MSTVFVLHHVRKDDEFGDDAKLVGVYSSAASAEAAKERLLAQPGFRAHPVGFQVSEYALDEDQWTEGFVTMTWINMPLEHEGSKMWTLVNAQVLDGGRYEIQGPVPEGENWRFPPGSIVLCVTEIENGKECLVASSIA